MGSMREWIDRIGAGAVRFESETDPNDLIRLEFSHAELGFAFRRDWQKSLIEAAPTAA